VDAPQSTRTFLPRPWRLSRQSAIFSGKTT